MANGYTLDPNQLPMMLQGAPQQQPAIPPGPMQGIGGPSIPLKQGAPASPEEKEARKQGWRGFFDQLQKDPGLQQAFLQIGTQLLQPIPAGQTAGGQVGQALQRGGEALTAQRAQQQATALATRKLDIEERKASAAEKAATGSAKLPASEVQVLDMLANAKVQEAAKAGKPISREQALLEIEKDRRTKSPVELISPLLPFLALTDDPAQNQQMITNLMNALSAVQGGGQTPPAPGAGGQKRYVWDDKAGNFVLK